MFWLGGNLRFFKINLEIWTKRKWRAKLGSEGISFWKSCKKKTKRQPGKIWGRNKSNSTKLHFGAKSSLGIFFDRVFSWYKLFTVRGPFQRHLVKPEISASRFMLMLRFNEGAEFKGRKGMHPTYHHPNGPRVLCQDGEIFLCFYVYMHVFIFICIYICRLYIFIYIYRL